VALQAADLREAVAAVEVALVVADREADSDPADLAAAVEVVADREARLPSRGPGAGST
jgi:hypothetical protein